MLSLSRESQGQIRSDARERYKSWIIYFVMNRRGNNKKNNLEQLTTQDTEDEGTQNKNTTQYVLDTTMCNQTQIT